MKMCVCALAVSFLALISSMPVAWGGNLIPPASFDNAKVMPKNIRTFRYNRIMRKAGEMFNAAGSAVTLGSPMNTAVTYRDIVEGQETPIEEGLFEGYLERSNYNMNATAGHTTGSVNATIDAQIFTLVWGITKSWTMAAAVPIVTVRTHVDTGFVAHSSLQNIANEMATDGRRFKATEMRDKTNSPISESNNEYGYEPLTAATTHREERAMGDVVLVNKIQFFSNKRYDVAFMGELTLPTGRRTDINRLIDVPLGDGQFDLGSGVVIDRNISDRARLSSRLSYTWQYKDQVARRIPQNSRTLISSDLDGQVDRNLGNIVYFSAGGEYGLREGVKLNAQYSFQYKQRDRYSGNKYESHRYDLLAKNSRQSLHALQLGINLSTIPWVLKKQFLLPLDLNLVSVISLAGKNVVKDPMFLIEGGMFF